MPGIPELSKEVHEERPVQVLTQLIQNKPETFWLFSESIKCDEKGALKEEDKKAGKKKLSPLKIWNQFSLTSGSCFGLNDGKTKVGCFGTVTSSQDGGQHQNQARGQENIKNIKRPFCLDVSASALRIVTGGLEVTFQH